MDIFYNGAKITELVTVRSCVTRDTCGDVCDDLELSFDNAAGWFRWKPKEDDEIRVVSGSLDTGVMYLKNVVPQDGIYRIMATALPCAARKREWRSFRGQNLENILRLCGIGTGMGYRLWGIDGGLRVPYIEQSGESAPAFLSRLLSMEGAALKCIDGRYTAIGILEAQERKRAGVMEIGGKDDGVTYLKKNQRVRALTVRTPYGEATAEDTDAPPTHQRMVMCLPALSAEQAGRWARGLLLSMNRADETLTVDSALDRTVRALSRFSVTGSALGDGDWMVQSAEHDLVNETTSAVLLRCVDTIL